MKRDEAEQRQLSEWMAAHQAGQPGAFEQLWAVLAPELRRFHTYLCHDPDRAEDLVQETFLRMHRARRTYDPDRPLKPWALAIARHVFLMDRRARVRRGAHEVPEHASGEAAVAGGAETAVEHRQLRDLLGRLPAARRAPLVLHHLLGLSFREIGERLGIGEGAARVRASRALSELRRGVDRERHK